MDYTETLNPSDGPDTFPELLQYLECNDFSHHAELIDHIEAAAALSAHMRQVFKEDSSVDSTELLQFVRQLEGMAAKGWYNAIEKLNNEDCYRQQITEMLGLLEERDNNLQELELIHQECEAERQSSEQIWRQLKFNEMEMIQLKEYIEMLEREKSEAMRGLESMVTRMESLFDQFERRHASNSPITTPKPPSPDTSPPTKTSRTTQTHSLTRQDLGFPFTTSPTPISTPDPDPDPSTHSSLLTEAGSLPTPSSTSYPPPLPLPLATEEARKAEERRTNMLSDVENTLWIQESKDREYLARRPPSLAPSSRTAQLPPSSVGHNVSSPPSSSSFSPTYIYIPLPRNFAIPRVKKMCASLVFPSAPAVFHFLGCATRDQVVELVRRVYGVGDGEDVEDTNVIRVRTHELEWELKNAIRKVLGKARWELVGGDGWSSEGRGDTYIVSKRDCYFDGHGGEAGLENRKGCDEVIGGVDGDREEQDVREDEWEEEYFEALELQDDNDDDDLEDMPRLRGGAPIVFQDSPISLRSTNRHSTGTSRTLAYHCGITSPTPNQEDTPFTHSQAWIEQARVLQLQNAAHIRMIEHLQEIIQDTEETVIWQDEELARAHTLITDLKCKVRKQRNETLTAASLADRAKQESSHLRELLDQIHSQLVRFNEELDDSESNITSRYPSSPLSPSSPSFPYETFIRGGGEASRVGEKEEFFDAGSSIGEIERGADTEEMMEKRRRAGNLGEKRGYGMVRPMPPVKVDGMFPRASCETSESAWVSHRAGRRNHHLRGFEDTNPYRPVGAHTPPRHITPPPPFPSHPLPHEFYPPTNLTPESRSTYQPHSPLHSPSPTTSNNLQTEATKTKPSTEIDHPDHHGWGTWRHPRNRQCETWFSPSSLNPARQNCSFCDLPFVEVSRQMYPSGRERALS